jgi:hypothetical protein
MKLNGTVVLVVLLAFWLVCPGAGALGFRTFNFVEMVIQADVIVFTNSMTRNGNNIRISAKEVIHGECPQVFDATFFSTERRVKGAHIMEGERVVFLSKSVDGLSLVGAGTQAIWPRTGNDEIDSPAANDIKTLSQLCRQVRGSIQLDALQRSKLLASLVDNPDYFVKGVGLQLCNYLYSQSLEKYKYEVHIGTAFGVENMGHPQNHVFYPAMQLALLTPPSVVLPRLLEAMRKASGSGQQITAFYHFTSVSGTRGKFNFQDNTDKPDEQLRAEGLKAVTAWLDNERFRLVMADAKQITDALKSDDASTRMVGRVWLQSATGNDFGFKETGTAEERAVVLVKVNAFLQNARAEAAKAAQPVQNLR